MIKKHVYFILFTILFLGMGWGSLVLLQSDGIVSVGQPLFLIMFMTGGFSPTLATFVSIALSDGKLGLSEYRKRLFKFKLPFWYIIFSILFLVFLGSVPALITGEVGDKFSMLSEIPWVSLPMIFISAFIFGGLEELGWRGFLQHELQKKLNIWLVYLILWVTWAVWHLPLFHIQGVSQYGQNFWVFSIYALFFSIFLGWLYGRTRSIPLAVFGHTLINTFVAIGYLNFLDRETVHWVAVLVVCSTLVGLQFLFPVSRTDHISV